MIGSSSRTTTKKEHIVTVLCVALTMLFFPEQLPLS
jgi:hypothetical protein